MDIFSLEKIYLAWKKFKRGKSRRTDVIRFEHNLESHLIDLQLEIENGKYAHGGYYNFIVRDKKKRNIAKSCVKDRIVHQLMYDYLNNFYENRFIHQSYSSRLGKGCDAAINDLRICLNKVTNNYSKACWILKCDIRKFFASVDHQVLLSIFIRSDLPIKIIKVLESIVSSYNSGVAEKGIPLGNLTSQIFANIYLQELDHFVKHTVKINNYFRYNDDMLLLLTARNNEFYEKLRIFCQDRLNLHLKCVYLRKFSWGIDFLGFKFYPYTTILRKQTYQKIIQNINELLLIDVRENCIQRHSKIASYQGLIKKVDGLSFVVI